MNANSFIKAHLNVNWLRPESALWDSIASAIISQYDIIGPSLDMGCGNGIFSFITAKGDFSLEYDWYINVDTQGFWENNDIYDVCRINTLEQYIIRKPRYCFTYGLDHKNSLLQQADMLQFYENVIQHDANLPLPFEGEKFRTVFSNILYWLKSPSHALKEIYRILSEDGTVILCIPNTKFLEYCKSYQWKEKGSELLRLINRGRAESVLWSIEHDDFVKLASGIGFRLISHSYYLSPVTLSIWDIGLRPLSPLLIKMANGLTVDKRTTIKAEWIDTAMKFLLPLYEMEKEYKGEGGFHLWVLKK